MNIYHTMWLFVLLLFICCYNVKIYTRNNFGFSILIFWNLIQFQFCRFSSVFVVQCSIFQFGFSINKKLFFQLGSDKKPKWKTKCSPLILTEACHNITTLYFYLSFNSKSNPHSINGYATWGTKEIETTKFNQIEWAHHVQVHMVLWYNDE